MSDFCKDCPDREACSQSYPCWYVKDMAADERRRKDGK